MESLRIEATKYTPLIDMDPRGIISLEGKSYPENTFEFYDPVMKWIREYFESNAAQTTTVNMEITYFNSSSSKLFFDFFDMIEEYHDDHDIQINWIYDEENESAQEAGEDFIEDFEDLNIKLAVKQG